MVVGTYHMSMLPNLATLHIAPQTRTRSGGSDNTSLTSKKQKNEPLPDGWTVVPNRSGDWEYLSPNKQFRTLSSKVVWERHRAGKDPPPADETEHVTAPTECQVEKGDYGSTAKDLHRMRILRDMETYTCENYANNLKVSLLYLGAEDGSDSLFFMQQIENNQLLKGATLTAVNRKNITKTFPGFSAGTINYVENTTIEDYLDKYTGEGFTHTWLDTTSKEIDNKLLWDAQRVTTTKIYLVVALKDHTGYRLREHSYLVTRVQCEFFGLRIIHEESYAGITPDKKQSNKINMVFTTCDASGASNKNTWNENYKCVGWLTDVPRTGFDKTKVLPKTLLKLNCTDNTLCRAMIVGCCHLPGNVTTWTLKLFGASGKLYEASFQFKGIIGQVFPLLAQWT